MPYDQTSDFTLNLRSKAASGAVHLIGNFVAEEKIAYLLQNMWITNQISNIVTVCIIKLTERLLCIKTDS